MEEDSDWLAVTVGMALPGLSAAAVWISCAPAVSIAMSFLSSMGGVVHYSWAKGSCSAGIAFVPWVVSSVLTAALEVLPVAIVIGSAGGDDTLSI